jgi:hypothetical protein
VQLSSINDIIAQDLNDDGNLDLIMAGNLYASEIETPRNDAGYGYILLGNGKGKFATLPFTESGFYLNKDTKDLAKIKTSKGLCILAANNNDFITLLKSNH